MKNVLQTICRWRPARVHAWCMVAGVILLLVAPSGPGAGENWYPLDVDVWTPPFNDQLQREIKQYAPLEKTTQKWRLHVFIPHQRCLLAGGEFRPH